MNSISNKRGHLVKVFILLIYLNIFLYKKELDICKYIYIIVSGKKNPNDVIAF